MTKVFLILATVIDLALATLGSGKSTLGVAVAAMPPAGTLVALALALPVPY